MYLLVRRRTDNLFDLHYNFNCLVKLYNVFLTVELDAIGTLSTRTICPVFNVGVGTRSIQAQVRLNSLYQFRRLQLRYGILNHRIPYLDLVQLPSQVQKHFDIDPSRTSSHLASAISNLISVVVFSLRTNAFHQL